jgi:hypothetical protein
MATYNLIMSWIALSKGWDTIEQESFGEPEMLNLVQYIKSSGISERLYGTRSVDRLILNLYDRIEFDREALHIRFNKQTAKWEFTYYSVPFKGPEFKREYNSDKGIEKFENFIRLINW